MEFLYELYTDSCVLAGGECNACLMKRICTPMHHILNPVYITSMYNMSTHLSAISYILKNFPTVLDIVRC